jgi:hypothetical protein
LNKFYKTAHFPFIYAGVAKRSKAQGLGQPFFMKKRWRKIMFLSPTFLVKKGCKTPCLLVGSGVQISSLPAKRWRKAVKVSSPAFFKNEGCYDIIEV